MTEVFKICYCVRICFSQLNYVHLTLNTILMLLICTGDVGLNPGPKKSNSCYNFSMCHWNLNSVAAHDLSKLSLLETYNVQRKFHMICLFETYLDSTIQYDDQILTLNGYKTLRAGKLMGVEYICLYITIVTTKLPIVNSTLKLNVLRYMND